LVEREDLEINRRWIESQLELVTNLAETWAESRAEVPNAEVAYRSAGVHDRRVACQPAVHSPAEVENTPKLKVAG
jgi:hypothetical protein